MYNFVILGCVHLYHLIELCCIVAPSLALGAKKRVKARERPERKLKRERPLKEVVKPEEDSMGSKSSLRTEEESQLTERDRLLSLSREEEEDSVADFPLPE